MRCMFFNVCQSITQFLFFLYRLITHDPNQRLGAKGSTEVVFHCKPFFIDRDD